MGKKEIRREVLKLRDALDEEAQVRAEILITERLLGHQWFYGSDVILGFVSYGSEIRTRQILEEAVRKGKKLFLPKVEGEEMHFYQAGYEDCVPGYRGILEPRGDTFRYEYSEEGAARTLLIMPGVCFDPYRNRIGYGKGFYDRFLADKPALWTRSIAIGHSCQSVPVIPIEEYDMRPYQVILV